MSDKLLYICRVCHVADTYYTGPAIENADGSETQTAGICEACCADSEDGHEFESNYGEKMCLLCGAYPDYNYEPYN